MLDLTNETNAIVCKLCGSSNTKKYGLINGEQRYFCKDCNRKFKNDDSLKGGRVSASDISSALLEYYSGLSINDIRNRILQEKGYKPSSSSVFQWVDKYTDRAVKYYDQFKPNVGDVWVADETAIKLDKDTHIWLWDIIDPKTKFLLASKISYTRSTDDAIILFELAKKRASKAPKTILTDSLAVYPEAINQVFGNKTHHEQSNPFVKNGEGDATRPIERWHETLKERTKVIYALRDTNSALAFLDGFFAYYNFIRKHDGLDGKTPAEVAGVDYDVKSWADVIHIGEYKPITFNHVLSLSLEQARTATGTPSRKPGRKAGVSLERSRKLGSHAKYNQQRTAKNRRVKKEALKVKRKATYQKGAATIQARISR